MGKMKKSDVLHEQAIRLGQLPTQRTLEQCLRFIKNLYKHYSKESYQGMLSFASFMYKIPTDFLDAYIKDQISPADYLLRPDDILLKKALCFIKEDAKKQSLEEAEGFLKGEELLCNFFYHIDGEEIEKFLKGNSVWSA